MALTTAQRNYLCAILNINETNAKNAFVSMIEAASAQTSWSGNAGPPLAASVLVAASGTSDYQRATDGNVVLGVCLEDVQTPAGKSAQIGVGYTRLACDVPVTQGRIKAARLGTFTRAITQAMANTPVTTQVGGNFANQPANDSVTLVSSNAGDTQNATVIGTTNGTTTVVREVIALNGVGAVNTVKADWGVILAVTLASPAVGTITFSETSGGLAIGTIAPAGTSAGYRAIVNGWMFNGIPQVRAEAGTTKYVGARIQQVDGTTESDVCVQLNGTTTTQLGTTKARKLIEILYGDLESARTGTWALGMADAEYLICGTVLAQTATEGEIVKCVIRA